MFCQVTNGEIGQPLERSYHENQDTEAGDGGGEGFDPMEYDNEEFEDASTEPIP